MALTDILRGAYRTAQNIVRPAVLGLALAYCGPTVDDDRGCDTDADCHRDRICNYNTGRCESPGGGNGSSNNGACGESPLVGRYLWEVSECHLSLSFMSDCRVGVASEENNQYNNNCLSPNDDRECSLPNPSYRGLEIMTGGYVIELNPDARFLRGIAGEPSAGIKKVSAEELNNILERYDGYILISPSLELGSDRPDDNAFVPSEKPYAGREVCRRRYWNK